MFNSTRFLLPVFYFFPFYSCGQTTVSGQTSQEYNYAMVNHWFDGTLMSDKKVDGSIYIKKNGKYYKLQYQGNLSGAYFGMTPNDDNDDTEALQKAINYAIATSQDLVVSSGRYYIDKTILIPQHFSYGMKNIGITFSNAVFVLRRDITLFRSDNWGSKEDSKMTNGLTLGNFYIESKVGNLNSYAIQIQDYHQGTKIENVSSINNKNLLQSRNSYYLELYNINSNLNGKGGKRFLFQGYHGLNKFTKLSANNSDIAYSFENGMVAALDMQNISIEGCRVGLNFTSEVYNLHLKSSYFENFETGLLFTNYIHSANIEDNYINFLNNPKSYLLEYKGLPLNNIFFNKGNTYLGTNFSNLVKVKEDDYGKGIVFDMSNSGQSENAQKARTLGKNISILK